MNETATSTIHLMMEKHQYLSGKIVSNSLEKKQDSEAY